MAEDQNRHHQLEHGDGLGQPGGQPAPPLEPWQQVAPQQAVHPPVVERQRGLPVGAWIGIGVGAVTLLALFLVSLIVILPMLTGLLKGPDPTWTGPGPGPESPTVPEPTESFGTDRVSLDDSLDIVAGPFWSTPIDEGWDIQIFDEDGYNHFTHSESGCQIVTFQGPGDPSETASDDGTATKNVVPLTFDLGLTWGEEVVASDIDVVPSGELDVLFNFETPVEFQRLSADYEYEGETFNRQMLLRTFMPSNGLLYAEVDCPGTSTDMADEVFRGLGLTDL